MQTISSSPFPTYGSIIPTYINHPLEIDFLVKVLSEDAPDALICVKRFIKENNFLEEIQGDYVEYYHLTNGVKEGRSFKHTINLEEFCFATYVYGDLTGAFIHVKRGKFIARGEFSKGLVNGRYERYTSEHEIFQGEFRENVQHGFSRYQCKDKSYENATYFLGKRDGICCKILAIGDTFQTHWNQGKQDKSEVQFHLAYPNVKVIRDKKKLNDLTVFAISMLQPNPVSFLKFINTFLEQHNHLSGSIPVQLLKLPSNFRNYPPDGFIGPKEFIHWERLDIFLKNLFANLLNTPFDQAHMLLESLITTYNLQLYASIDGSSYYSHTQGLSGGVKLSINPSTNLISFQIQCVGQRKECIEVVSQHQICYGFSCNNSWEGDVLTLSKDGTATISTFVKGVQEGPISTTYPDGSMEYANGKKNRKEGKAFYNTLLGDSFDLTYVQGKLATKFKAHHPLWPQFEIEGEDDVNNLKKTTLFWKFKKEKGIEPISSYVTNFIRSASSKAPLEWIEINPPLNFTFQKVEKLNPYFQKFNSSENKQQRLQSHLITSLPVSSEFLTGMSSESKLTHGFEDNCPVLIFKLELNPLKPFTGYMKDFLQMLTFQNVSENDVISPNSTLLIPNWSEFLKEENFEIVDDQVFDLKRTEILYTGFRHIIHPAFPETIITTHYKQGKCSSAPLLRFKFNPDITTHAAQINFAKYHIKAQIQVAAG